MDERSSKRIRHREEDGNARSGGHAFGEFAGGSKLAGCHLDVKVSTSYIFLGQPVEVEVRLLNDEDLVQHTTVSINVSVTRNNKSLDSQEDVFQLTPQRPALVDGTCTFQLVIWDGAVAAGNRIRVHIEAVDGGDMVKADSESLMVCRSALAVVTQPPELWYKDEGGKNNCIEICVQVREKASGKEQAGIPLTLALVYEAGTEVHSQEILQVQSDTQLVTNELGRAYLKFKITEVSQRHQSQKFRVKISPDIRTSPMSTDVAPVMTVPIVVLSKRKNRRIRTGHVQAVQGYLPNPALQAPNPSVYGAPRMINVANPAQVSQVVDVPLVGSQRIEAAAAGHPPQPWGNQAGALMPAPMPPATSPPPPTAAVMSQQPQHHAPQHAKVAPVIPSTPVIPPTEGEKPLRVPTGATGSLHQVFKWTDSVLELLQVDLQWEHIGYEREPDGSAAYDRPLWRCPLCRVCKDMAHPRQPHSPDCRLQNLLAEFDGRTRHHFAETVREQKQYACQNEGGGVGGRTGVGVAGAGMGAGEGGAGSSNAGSNETGKDEDGGDASSVGAAGRGEDDRSGEKRKHGQGGGSMVAAGNGPARDSPPYSRGSSIGVGLLGSSTIERVFGGLEGAPPSLGNNEKAGEHDNDAQSSGFRVPSHVDLLGRDSSLTRGLSLNLVGLFDPSLAAPVHTAGDSGVSNRQSLSRTGSVAPFLPPRRRLSPDEEKAHFIMLPSGDGTGDWDSELGINKQMTVFSSRKKLLGFYEEKWDGQQTQLPFQPVEGNRDVCTAPAVAALEARLLAALAVEQDEEGGDEVEPGRSDDKALLDSVRSSRGQDARYADGDGDQRMADVRSRVRAAADRDGGSRVEGEGSVSLSPSTRKGSPARDQDRDRDRDRDQDRDRDRDRDQVDGEGGGGGARRAKGASDVKFGVKVEHERPIATGSGAAGRGIYRLQDFRNFEEMKEQAFLALAQRHSVDTKCVF